MALGASAGHRTAVLSFASHVVNASGFTAMRGLGLSSLMLRSFLLSVAQ